MNNIFQIIADIYLAFFEAKIICIFYQLNYFHSILGIFLIILQFVFLYFHIKTLQLLIDQLVLSSIFLMVLTMSISRKFTDINQKWLTNRKWLKNGNFVLKVQRKLTKLLIFICIMDRTYSIVIFVYLIFNCPTNAYLITNVIFGRKKSMINIYINYLIIFEQIVFVFIFHLIAAQITKNIHLPGKKIMYIFNHIEFDNSRKQLTSSIWLEKFHTNKPYGITYGHTNLITMKTFSKV